MATPMDLGTGLQLIARLFSEREVEAELAAARITEDFASRYGADFIAYLRFYGVEEFEADLAHIYYHSVLTLHERECVVLDHLEERYRKGKRLRGAYSDETGAFTISALEAWYPQADDADDDSWL